MDLVQLPQQCPRFGFLDLPPEVRFQIEVELLVRSEPVGCHAITFGHDGYNDTRWLPPTSGFIEAKTWHVNPEILRVCRAINLEGCDILYGRNIFGIEISAEQATFLDGYSFEHRSAQVPVHKIRNFDIMVKLQFYEDFEQTRDLVGTVSKILSESSFLKSLTITIIPPLESETASESAETQPEPEALRSESGSKFLDRSESYQILWPLACLLRKVQRVTINGIRSKHAKCLQEEMRGDKPRDQLDQQFSIYKEIVFDGLAADLRALDASCQSWDSAGFFQCLKKSVQRVPIHLQSTMRIWRHLSGQSNNTIEVLESLCKARAEEVTIPGHRKRARSL